jgi:hypothetical protein
MHFGVRQPTEVIKGSVVVQKLEWFEIRTTHTSDSRYDYLL